MNGNTGFPMNRDPMFRYGSIWHLRDQDNDVVVSIDARNVEEVYALLYNAYIAGDATIADYIGFISALSMTNNPMSFPSFRELVSREASITRGKVLMA